MKASDSDQGKTRDNTGWVLVALIIIVLLICAVASAHAAPDQEARWSAARINPARSIELDKAVALAKRLRPRYEVIQAMRPNGVPWSVLFCLHQRESSGSFTRHPHEGSPLTHRTRDVPKGRLPSPAQPPFSFEQSAEDAYYVCDRLDRVDWNSVQGALWGIERFNGSGYALYHPDVPSPYLWSGTSVYRRGKYTADGHFDRLAVDRQLGAAAILLRMRERGIEFSF